MVTVGLKLIFVEKSKVISNGNQNTKIVQRDISGE